MRTLTLRKAAAAAVLPLAVSSLAACGSSNSTAGTANDPQPSSPSSTATSPSTGSPSTGSSAPAQGQSVDPAAFVNTLKAAAKNITTAKFQMNMDISGQTITANGALDMTGATPAMQMSMDLTGMGTPTDMRLIGGAMYMTIPGAGGKFVKIDLKDPNGPLAGYGDTLGSMDPQSMIDQMSPQAFQKVTYVGTESVGGQQLKHYSVVLDTSAATSMLKGMPTSASLPKTIAYDLWLDSEGRMAKFEMKMKKVMDVTATYTAFGTPVHITAPSPSDVESIPTGSTS
jgi:hypothetical protein